MLEHPSGETVEAGEIENTPGFDKHEDLQRKIKRANRCSWCCGISAFLLVAVAAATPFAMNYLINASAKKSSALTQANEQSWRGIPGYYDIGLYWKHYMYNVTNFDDVSTSNFIMIYRLYSKTKSLSLWSSDLTSTESMMTMIILLTHSYLIPRQAK